jgi:CheY-like chemotaxis protein
VSGRTIRPNGLIAIRSSHTARAVQHWLKSAHQLNSLRMELQQATTVPSHTGNPIWVVLIENDLPVAWRYKLALEEAGGFNVLIADDGSGGLRLAAGVLPDVIVLDLELPDMPGCEVLARLNAREETSSIPVVTLSNDSSKISVKVCRLLGAVDNLARSRSSPELLARLLPMWTCGSDQK